MNREALIATSLGLFLQKEMNVLVIQRRYEYMEEEPSREEELFWTIDGILTKTVPLVLGITVLYLIAHLVIFLR